MREYEEGEEKEEGANRIIEAQSILYQAEFLSVG